MPKGVFLHHKNTGNPTGRLGCYRKSNVREMSPVEAAWIGAMIEAEGSVIFRPQHSGHLAKISMTNCDPEVLSAMLRVTGAGHLYPAPVHRWGRKPVFHWGISAWNEVKDIVRQCAAYSMKLQKVEV